MVASLAKAGQHKEHARLETCTQCAEYFELDRQCRSEKGLLIRSHQVLVQIAQRGLSSAHVLVGQQEFHHTRELLAERDRVEHIVSNPDWRRPIAKETGRATTTTKHDSIDQLAIAIHADQHSSSWLVVIHLVDEHT